MITNKFVLKIISIILSLTLMLSFNSTVMATIVVHAAESTINDDATKEAEEDAQSKSIKAGNWSEAHYKDGLPWNYFHIAVQNHIVSKYTDKGYKNVEKELTVDTGRVDLYRIVNDNEADDYQSAYFWEVKPGSYLLPTKMEKAKEQLGKYVDSPPKTERGITENKVGDTYIDGVISFQDLAASLNIDLDFELDISFDYFLDETKEYFVMYTNMGNGIILYWFAKISDDDNDGGEIEFDPNLFNGLLLSVYLAMFRYFSKNYNGGSTPAPAFSSAYGDATNDARESILKRFESEKINENEGAEVTSKVFVSTVVIAAMCGYAIKAKGSSKLTPQQASHKKLLKVCANLATAYALYMSTYPIYTNAAGYEYIEIETDSELYLALEEFRPYLELLPNMNDEEAVAIYEALYLMDEEKIDELIGEIQDLSKDYEDAGNASPPRDPLIIDLGKSGIDLYSLENGVNFDLDNNGFAEKTAWIGEEDGFLALDRNGNGKIDNGGELFGDQVILKDGSISTSGFEALSEFDEDCDGKITLNDSVYAELLVWIDSDHSGTSEPAELKSLTSIDGKEIVSINLNYAEVSFVDKETGSRIAETAEVIMNENDNTKSIEISEFWFPVNSSDTTQGGTITAGNVPDLIQAIENDESGILFEFYYAFSESENISQKRYFLKQILYYVTGSADIDVDSRGGNIDARDLNVIEAFMGREFEGVGGVNPNTNAAVILKDIYADIENQYYNILNMYSSLGGYVSSVFEYVDDNGNKFIDLELLYYIFDLKESNGENIDSLIYDLGIYLKSYDKMHGTSYYTEYKERYSDYYEQMIKLTESSVTYLGVDSNDSYNGTNNNDFIFGEAGNDKLYGLVGHDYMYGSIGNDILYGGIGDDSYCFELFHGNDVIYDTDGDNKLVFNEDLDFNAYNISIEVNGGFILTNKYTDETISLPDFLTNPINYDFIFNGETQTLGGGESREVIEGTAEDNYLEAGDGFNVFYGGDGNDTLAGGANMDFMYGENGDDLLLGRNGVNVLFGGTGNDTIYDGDDGSYLNGGDGDDSLYGGGGADVLDGGAGNDYLQADHGNDTYVFGKGYDTDTINASSDLNTVIVHGYRSTDMINTRNAHNDLIINFKNSDDCLIIDHFFDYNSNRDFNFVFDDGTVLGQYDITAKYAPIDGTDADEWLAIQNSDDGIIHGNGGNDGVSGGSGNDELYGDSGDDTLYGNDGNDILDGGTGTDGLNGGNGTDTYIFAKGYGNDTVNEWGSDHSIIKLTDINSDEVTVTDQYGSNLLLSVIDTEDTLVISNFKWGQATYTFEFADGAVATVNKDTWVFEFSQLPVVSEEEEVTTSDTTIVTDETIVETEVSVETTENEEVQSTEESDTSVETENTASEVIIETEDTTTNDLVDEFDSAETKEVTEQTDSQEADAAENVSEDVTEETGSNIIDETEASVETDVTE